MGKGKATPKKEWRRLEKTGQALGMISLCLVRFTNGLLQPCKKESQRFLWPRHDPKMLAEGRKEESEKAWVLGLVEKKVQDCFREDLWFCFRIREYFRFLGFIIISGMFMDVVDPVHYI